MHAEPLGGVVHAVAVANPALVTAWCLARLAHIAALVALANEAGHHAVAREDLEDGLSELLDVSRSGVIPD